MFETFLWQCVNEDKKIFIHQICDGDPHCERESDEDTALCFEGNFNITLGGIYCLVIYLTTGSLIYCIVDIGTKIKNSPPQLSQDGQDKITDHSSPTKEVTSEGEEDKEDKEEDETVNKLDFLFHICKHYCNSVKKIKKLNYDHRRKISDTYGKCHSEGEDVFRFFQCLKCLSVDPTFLKTCQLIVDELYRVEIDYHHCGNNEKALICIKQHLRYGIICIILY